MSARRLAGLAESFIANPFGIRPGPLPTERGAGVRYSSVKVFGLVVRVVDAEGRPGSVSTKVWKSSIARRATISLSRDFDFLNRGMERCGPISWSIFFGSSAMTQSLNFSRMLRQ